MTKKQLLAEKALLVEELNWVNAQLETKTAASRIKCENTGRTGKDKGCGKTFAVKDLTFIQMHYYDHNTGSPNGGFYRESESQWECPSCHTRIRSYFNKTFVPLQRFFKEVIKEYPSTSWRGY